MSESGSAKTYRNLLFILILAIIVVVSVALIGRNGDVSSDGPETVTINGHTFHLEVAADPASRELGLGDRTSVPEDGGLMFIFPEPQLQRFWMRNCLVDIDIVYLDAKGRVTAIHAMKKEPPQREGETDEEYFGRLPGYSSGARAQFALEFQAGWLERLDLNIEDKVPLDLDRLKAMAR